MSTYTYDQLLEDWNKAKAAKRAWEAEERRLRGLVVEGAFGDKLKEGANKFTLADGRVIKVTGKINRTIDATALTALSPKLRELGVDVEELVRFKPELKVGPFRKLAGEGGDLFRSIVTEKEGTPEVEIV